MIGEILISMRGKLLLAALGIIFILFLFSLLKKRRITESFALVWLAVSIGMIIVISSDIVLIAVTHAVGATYPASALTMIALLFIFSILLYFTLKLSTLTQKQREVIQELCIQNLKFEERLRRLEHADNGTNR